jgi:hypothetical protein
MVADDSERKRQIRRATREASIRGLLTRVTWIFRIVAPFMGVGMVIQSWKIATGKIAPEEVDVVRYQTRNGFIVVGFMIALLLFFDWLQARFEASVAERDAIAPLPEAAWKSVHLANRIRALLYPWTIRVCWPIFLGLIIADSFGLSTPPMGAGDRTMFSMLGCTFFLLWVFLARTKGPWTINSGGRLEREPAIESDDSR